MLFTAKDLQRWRWRISGAPGIGSPEGVVFCLQPDLIQQARRRFPLKPVKGLFGETYRYKNRAGQAMLAGGFGVGSPLMAILVEEYAAFGASRFLSIGLAGSLQPDLHPGDVVISESAIRDEGTSNHYLAPAGTVDANREMVQAVRDLLSARGVRCLSGVTWTTDAPFRETNQDADRYRRQGVLCVDMEAAALYAVSQSKRLPSAAVFVIADRLLESGWEPPESMSPVKVSLNQVINILLPWLAGEIP